MRIIISSVKSDVPAFDVGLGLSVSSSYSYSKADAIVNAGGVVASVSVVVFVDVSYGLRVH